MAWLHEILASDRAPLYIVLALLAMFVIDIVVVSRNGRKNRQ